MSATASAPPPRPKISSGERLSATLALSLIVHGILVLGLGFALDDPTPAAPTLDVILSQTQTALTPKEADFLAAANQQGGGDSDLAKRPRDDQAGWAAQAQAGLSPLPLQAQSPDRTPPPEPRAIISRDGEWSVPAAQTRPPADTPDLPDSDAKVERDAEMARLAAEIHLRSELYAKRPKRKFVSASTREYAYANYLRAWVDRAERVGNLNYPDEARRQRLAGQVVITVGVRRDGSVEQARILQSSGIPLLDSTALRIVQLAAPFPPLPQGANAVDVLHVTRTWQFLPGGEIRDR